MLSEPHKLSWFDKRKNVVITTHENSSIGKKLLCNLDFSHIVSYFVFSCSANKNSLHTVEMIQRRKVIAIKLFRWSFCWGGSSTFIYYSLYYL